MKCKKCGRTFPDYGKCCPYCGTVPKKRIAKKTVAMICAAFIAVGAITAGGLIIGKKRGTKNYSNRSTAEDEPGEIYYSPIDEDHIGKSADGILFADNEILLTANEGASRSDIESLADSYSAEIVGYIEKTGDYQLKLDKVYSYDELDALREKLCQNEDVYRADVNYISYRGYDSADEIDIGDKYRDSYYFYSDGLHDLTSPHYEDDIDKINKRWNIDTINAPAAWKIMNDHRDEINPIKVGLIDSKMDADHEDLGFAHDGIFYNKNLNGVEVTENDNHGTHVAGTMAAIGTNREGICGIYPYADGRLYGVVDEGVLDYRENKVSCIQSKVEYAELILRGVKVINSSIHTNSTFAEKKEDAKIAMNDLITLKRVAEKLNGLQSSQKYLLIISRDFCQKDMILF